jgi:hypothetical protein
MPVPLLPGRIQWVCRLLSRRSALLKELLNVAPA